MVISCILTAMNMHFMKPKNVFHLLEQKMQDTYIVTPVSYIAGDTEQVDRIKEIHTSVKEKGRIECVVLFEEGDDKEYWSFYLENIRSKGDKVIAGISQFTFESGDWAYMDDRASGTFIFDKKEETETLDVHYKIHSSDYHAVISWKLKPESD